MRHVAVGRSKEGRIQDGRAGRTEGPRAIVEARVRREKVSLCLETHVHGWRRTKKWRKEKDEIEYRIDNDKNAKLNVCKCMFAGSKFAVD